MNPWKAWDWDVTTMGWVLWIIAFVVLESYTIVQGKGEELTNHLRPVFLEQTLTWWIALGAWIWLGLHFLAPRVERALREFVSSF